MYITPFKRRKIDASLPVYIYRNITRGDGVWYSVKQRGVVVGHCREITLSNVSFIVNKSGRNRTLRTRVKNVHAFVCGLIIGPSNRRNLIRVSYNPYKYKSFVTNDGLSVHTATVAVLNSRGLRAFVN